MKPSPAVALAGMALLFGCTEAYRWPDRMSRRPPPPRAEAPEGYYVIEQGDTHWHGYPTPLACPEDRGRCAVATYFYTADASEDAPEAHSAIWAPRR